jgi:hypothetical protein
MKTNPLDIICYIFGTLCLAYTAFTGTFLLGLLGVALIYAPFYMARKEARQAQMRANAIEADRRAQWDAYYASQAKQKLFYHKS